MRILLFTIMLAACGDDGGNAPIDARLVHDGALDAAPDAPADPRGPATFELAGGANGLAWDDATATLYLTNNNTDALVKFTDAGKLQQVGTFPPATAGISLGDIVRRADGTTLVPSFGFGTQGTIFAMGTDNASKALTGLDPARRRIGFAQDSTGALYDTYFVGGGGGMPNGGVAAVTIAGDVATETEIASSAAGLKKLVGIVATPSALFVADQTQNKIFKLAVPGFAVTPLADVPSADLLSIMPNGDLLTGGTGIHRITQAGVVTTILPGFEQVRGLAYDPTLRRLFVIEHSATVGVPDKLHVRPLDN